MHGFTASDQPTEQPDLCVLLADPAGSLIDGTGNCVRVPVPAGDTSAGAP
jgi:hypothetical protein